MEILFVSHKYPPSTGGMEKQSYELINGMKRYATVHAILPKEGESKLAFFAALRKKITLECEMHPDITLIHFNDALIAAVCLGHKDYLHLQRVVTVHGLDIVFPNWIYQRFILPKFNRFDLIIAVSHATAKACMDRKIDPKKVIVVPNGVDHSIADINQKERFSVDLSAKFDYPGGKPILVAMGRAVKRKGFSWFIERVMPSLPKEFLLLIIGPFSLEPTQTEKILRWLPSRLRRQIELALGFPTDEANLRILLKKSPNVKHLGKLPFEEVLQILQSADAFVMPNIAVNGDMEGFGLVCLEASLAGTYVLAANIDGIPEAIHDGENGMLLPSGNVSVWSNTLNNLAKNPKFYNQKGENSCLYTLQHFGWEQMVKAYMDTFYSLKNKT